MRQKQRPGDQQLFASLNNPREYVHQNNKTMTKSIYLSNLLKYPAFTKFILTPGVGGSQCAVRQLRCCAPLSAPPRKLSTFCIFSSGVKPRASSSRHQQHQRAPDRKFQVAKDHGSIVEQLCCKNIQSDILFALVSSSSAVGAGGEIRKL